MTAITPAATPAALSTSRPVAGAAPARTPARSPSPTSVGLGPRPAEPRKAARRSRPDIDLVRRTDGPQDRVEQTLQDLRVPSPTGSQRRRARSRPSADEVPPTSPDDTGGQSTSPDAAPSTRTPSRSDEIDAWPTESLSGGVPPGDPDDDPPDEKTRIGVPAYEASARMATVASEASSPAIDADPSLPVAQALRVLVWRAADGVRVAPAGTRVSAPTIEAVLVALDASADLAAWLAGK